MNESVSLNCRISGLATSSRPLGDNCGMLQPSSRLSNTKFISCFSLASSVERSIAPMKKAVMPKKRNRLTEKVLPSISFEDNTQLIDLLKIFVNYTVLSIFSRCSNMLIISSSAALTFSIDGFTSTFDLLLVSISVHAALILSTFVSMLASNW